ncbi:MAG: hypothetical protein AAFV88_24205, partial [Planctomycetota bacterium]
MARAIFLMVVPLESVYSGEPNRSKQVVVANSLVGAVNISLIVLLAPAELLGFQRDDHQEYCASHLR